MRIRISHLVNSLTRQALYETVPGYVPKESDFAAIEEDARRRGLSTNGLQERLLAKGIRFRSLES